MEMVRTLRTDGSGSLLRVNIRAVHENLAWIRDQSGGRPVIAVVKANAYGIGAVMMARFLCDEVEGFAVATTDEGGELREAGIRKPILVFGPPRAATVRDYAEFQLTASLSGPEQAMLLPDGVAYQMVLDSGMRRYGVAPEQLDRVRETLSAASHLTYRGCYSHHAVADEPENDAVYEQIGRFEEMVRQAVLEGPLHMSNSAAVLHAGSIPHFDQLRVGLGLYGYAPGLPRPDALQPALEWQSTLELVRPIRKGEAVSYGGTWRADQDGWLGTMPVGYADGLPRALSNKLEVSVEGRRFRQVGRVTMDATMVYLEKPIREGTPVTLFGGEGWSLYEWSDSIGSIPHESLTRLSDRVKRVYFF
ncbi:MAG: alanine racemase [Bacteroidota bacterium]